MLSVLAEIVSSNQTISPRDSMDDLHEQIALRDTFRALGKGRCVGSLKRLKRLKTRSENEAICH